MKQNGETDTMATLEQQVDLLCARSEALAREIRRLRQENQRLRDNTLLAKQKIRDIMAQLPEVDDIGRIN